MMRRFAATGHRKDLGRCAELLSLAPTPDDAKRLISGFEAAYAGRSLPDLPNDLASALERYSGESVVLGLRRGSAPALEEALKTLRDDRADRSKQLQYIQVLGEVSQPSCVPTLIGLATTSADNALQTAALRSLVRYDDARISPAVLTAFPKMSDDVRAAAGSLLTHRAKWTLALLQAINSRQIDRAWLSPELVQRMGLFSNSEIDLLVQKNWPDVRPTTPDELKKVISRVAGVLEAGVGTPKDGKATFTQQCSRCHKLFGEGGAVGPDLTSFNRNDLNAMLLSIVHPSAEVREGYTTNIVITNDGRTITGRLADQDPQMITLHTTEGASVSIPRNEIDEMVVSKQSMMPEGLLSQYSDQQLRDLFADLRMTQPLLDR
jgi:putative heme-binding domain-containing protein